MATTRWYLNNTTVDGWALIDQTAASAATYASGWVVGTGSTNSSEFQSAGGDRASTTFTANTVPDGTLDTTLKDAFRSLNVINGSFAAGNWTFQFAVQGTVQSGAADGQIVFRVIKADANGANATEITSSQQAASVVTNVTTTDLNSSATISLGAFTVTNQHLFIQVAWKRTGAGGMTTTNVRLRTGSSSSVGTTGLTTDFTNATVLVAHIASTAVAISAWNETLLLEQNVTNFTSSSPTAGLAFGQTWSQDLGDTLWLSSVSVRLAKEGAPTDSVYVEIRQGSANSGPIVATSQSVLLSSLTTAPTYEWINFVFPDGVQMRSVQPLVLCVKLTRVAQDNANKLWFEYASTNPYASGSFINSLGASVSGWDSRFRIYTGTRLTVAVDQAVTGGTILSRARFPQGPEDSTPFIDTGATGNATLDITDSTTVLRQSFVGHGGWVTSVSIRMKKIGTPDPTSGLSVQFTADSPSGILMGYSYVVEPTAIGTTFDWVTFLCPSNTLTNPAVWLAAGATYYVHLVRNGVVPEPINYYTVEGSTTSLYAGGGAILSGGAPAFTNATGDMLFQMRTVVATAGPTVIVSQNIVLPTISAHTEVSYYDQSKLGAGSSALIEADRLEYAEPTKVLGQSFHIATRFSAIETILWTDPTDPGGTLTLSVRSGNQTGTVIATASKPVTDTVTAVPYTYKLYRFEFPTIDPGGSDTLYTWTLIRTGMALGDSDTYLFYGWPAMAPAGNPRHIFDDPTWDSDEAYTYFTKVLRESVFAPTVAVEAPDQGVDGVTLASTAQVFTPRVLSGDILLLTTTTAVSADGTTVTTAPIDTTGATAFLVHMTRLDDGGGGAPGSDIPGMSDSYGNTWHSMPGMTDSPVTMRGRLFYVTAPLITGAGHTFSFTQGQVSRPSLVVVALHGLDAGWWWDSAELGTTPTGTSLALGSLQVPTRKMLYISGLVFGASNTPSINAGMTIAAQLNYSAGVNQGNAVALRVEDTAAAVSPTWSWATACGAAATLFNIPQAFADPPRIASTAQMFAPTVAAAGGLPILDPCSGASGTLLPGWTRGSLNSDVQYDGSGKMIATQGGINDVRWTGTAFENDQYAQADYNDGSYAAVCTRMSGTTYPHNVSAYVFIAAGAAYGNALKLQKYVNGGWSADLQVFSNLTGAHTLRLESVATTHRCYVDGVQVGTDTIDASFSGGAPGVLFYNAGTGATLDNIELGTPSVAGSTVGSTATLYAPTVALPVVNIAFDAATDLGNNGAITTSYTAAHTCSGTNRVLFVGVKAGTVAQGDLVTGATYNGVPMTLVAKKSPGVAGADGNRWIYLFVLFNPASGTNNVVITMSDMAYIIGVAASYTNVQNAVPIDASSTASVPGNSTQQLTTTATTVTDRCWTVAVMGGFDTNLPMTAGAGTTRRTYDAAFGTITLFDSAAPVTPAGATSLIGNYTGGSANGINGVMAAFMPVVPAGTILVTPILTTATLYAPTVAHAPSGLPVFDPCSGADGTLLPGWTRGAASGGGLKYNGSGKMWAPSDAFTDVRWTGDTFDSDHYSQLVTDNHAFIAVTTRMPSSPTLTGYFFFLNGNVYGNGSQLQRVTGGSATVLQTFGNYYGSSHVMRLESQGSTHRCYVGGAQIGTDQTDATYSGGAPGVSMYNSTQLQKADDIELGNLAQAITGVTIASTAAAYAPTVSSGVILPFYDNCNGAVGTLHSAWTGFAGTPRYNGSGQMYGVDGGYNVARFDGAAIDDDQYIQCVTNSAADLSVGTRLTFPSGTFSGYMFWASSTFCGLYRYDVGSEVELQTFATISGTKTIRLESEGNTHRCYVNGVQVGTDEIDATYPTGGSVAVSIYNLGTSPLVDDIEVGNYVPSAAPSVVYQRWRRRMQVYLTR